jgi:sugar phosphate isomerase/epimerase
MPRIPIALQLFSVRRQCVEDLEGTLKAAADMGYEGVEFAGYHGHEAPEIRRMLDALGLAAAGSHLGIQLMLGDSLAATIEFERALGNRYLVVPGLPGEMTDSRGAWERTAGLFRELANDLAAHGMRVGYHNHTAEFTPLDGETPWDIFFGSTSPDVIMQLDTGNALHVGADPVPYVERYPGRATTVHLKEHSATNEKALIGEGDVDWPRLLDLCETVGGTEWYIVEQESHAYPPLDCVARCLENLRRMGR